MPTKSLTGSGVVASGDLFAINGVALFAPDGYQESPMPVVGYNLRGEPIRQGYPAIVFTWSLMKQEHLSALLAAVDPEDPQVLLQFVDKATGSPTVMYAMLEEPIVGARYIVYYQNVALKATRLTTEP